MNVQTNRTDHRPLRSWSGPRGKWLRFVLLEHLPERRPSHFDLMLEFSHTRSLWDLETPENPVALRSQIRWATHGFHRRRYLRFEGDIGHGRGVVRRIDSGRYCVTASAGCLVIQLRGRRWKGTYFIWRQDRGQHIWTAVAE